MLSNKKSLFQLILLATKSWIIHFQSLKNPETTIKMPTKTKVEQLSDTLLRICKEEEVEVDDIVRAAVQFFASKPFTASLKQSAVVDKNSDEFIFTTVDISGSVRKVSQSTLYPTMNEVVQM